ncbi:hypothetical protein [Entomospira culicis]|uniref:Outer membrane protein beta-barrel domain-containing protein n=1 Tax=Entomospira culicis TaxID=2719989 RepID=A0A968GE26_9SPIO|nr:hypothetical protein [Entomospira culicis]NIZ18661.1 hypothetical protein [Entomospira culicis]NIZ68876.1 hypothetical protein [Entomospira culicis]WDI37469.1 hypothetical protein PVA46_01390 [Entomospira culicis]WDI39097.1 hypothetical protein PVA47_01395 [Entomospira culicis]
MMLCALALIGATSANAAVGIGLVGEGSWGRHGGANPGFGLNVAIGEMEEIFMEIGITTWFGTKANPHGIEINLDAPFHVFMGELTDSVLFYVGVGPHIGFHNRKSEDTNNVLFEVKTSSTNWEFGAIMPVGLRFVTEMFDFWFAVVPSGGVSYNYSSIRTKTILTDEEVKTTAKAYTGMYYGIGLQTGFRFWIG